LLEEQAIEADNMSTYPNQGAKYEFIMHIWMNMQSMWW
jgi:hypothetical protein